MIEELTPDQRLRKLNQLRKEIEEVKVEQQQKVGRKQEKESELKRSFGISDLDGVRRELKNLEKKITTRNRNIEVAYNELAARFEF